MKKMIMSFMAVTLVAGSLVGCGMDTNNNRAGIRADDHPRGMGNSAGIRNTADTSPTTNNGTFSDVPKTRWSSDSIEWARDQGIMQGTGQGIFNPTQPLTREQMAAVLKNLADKGYIVVREADTTPDTTPATPATPATPDTTPDTTPATPDTTPTTPDTTPATPDTTPATPDETPATPPATTPATP